MIDLDVVEYDRATVVRLAYTAADRLLGASAYYLATVHVPALVARVRELEARARGAESQVSALIAERDGG